MKAIQEILSEYGLEFESINSQKEPHYLLNLEHINFPGKMEDIKQSLVDKFVQHLFVRNFGPVQGRFRIVDKEKYQKKSVKKTLDLDLYPQEFLKEIEIVIFFDDTRKSYSVQIKLFRHRVSQVYKTAASEEIEDYKEYIWNKMSERVRMKLLFDDKEKNKLMATGIYNDLRQFSKKITRSKAMRDFKREVKAMLEQQVRWQMEQQCEKQKINAE